MLKRVNFTGRRRVPRDRVQVDVYDGQPRTFRASIDLDGLGMSPHAAVFLEAMCARSSVVERFDFGEVGALICDHEHELREVEGENVFFALKIVDRAERFGRILGTAENIRPYRAGKQTAAGRRGILPIEPTDLKDEIWRLEFREHDVFLLVNEKIPGLVDHARSNPLFYATVYPEVVRHVLIKAFADGSDIDEEEDRWPTMWLRFGKGLHPNQELPPTGLDREEEQEEWIEDIVQTFCRTHNMRSKYANTVANAD